MAPHDRTEALDELTNRFMKRELALPANARELGLGTRNKLGEFYRQLLSTQRSLDQDAAENWIPVWPKPGKPDHYLHAELYAMIAEQGGGGGRIGRVVTVDGAGSDMRRAGLIRQMLENF